MSVKLDDANNANAALALDVHGLTAAYGRIRVLHGVSIGVKPGQLVALVGANGAGKTTLLKTLSGLMTPLDGTISYSGKW